MREGKAKVLDDTEFKRLIRIAGVEKHAERNVAVCMCLWGLGMRVGEVAAIRIQDVLAEDGNVRNHFQVRRRDSKTNTNRDIYLSNPKLRRALKDYIGAYLINCVNDHRVNSNSEVPEDGYQERTTR